MNSIYNVDLSTVMEERLHALLHLTLNELLFRLVAYRYFKLLGDLNHSSMQASYFSSLYSSIQAYMREMSSESSAQIISYEITERNLYSTYEDLVQLAHDLKGRYGVSFENIEILVRSCKDVISMTGELCDSFADKGGTELICKFGNL